MDDMIVLHNEKRVPLPMIRSQKSCDLGWYTDALQDILPRDKLVEVQSWAFEQSQKYDKSLVEYWYAVLVAIAASAAGMEDFDFLRRARSNPSLCDYFD